MAEPYVGQISIFGFPFAPRSWAFCDGSTVPLNQFTALYALIGTTFGGDGRSTVGLPNLGGMSPCGTGTGPSLTNRVLGQSFGAQTVTLDTTTMPSHTHAAQANAFTFGVEVVATPTATAALTNSVDVDAYSNGAANIPMSPVAASPNGGGGAHNNMQPYLAVNYGIALQGLFPYFD